MANILPLQGLCTCCSLCLEDSSPCLEDSSPSDICMTSCLIPLGLCSHIVSSERSDLSKVESTIFLYPLFSFLLHHHPVILYTYCPFSIFISPTTLRTQTPWNKKFVAFTAISIDLQQCVAQNRHLVMLIKYLLFQFSVSFDTAGHILGMFSSVFWFLLLLWLLLAPSKLPPSFLEGWVLIFPQAEILAFFSNSVYSPLISV